MNIAQEVARQLLQINAIKLSPQKPFTWASGLRSPIYCDNRVVLSHPAVRRFIIDCFVEKAAAFEPFDLVAGVATAGIAHGALLADRLGLPFVYVRSKAKSHGRENQIEGELKEGQSALVIEDLISTGGSCLQAVEALRQAGCTTAGVLAIFTYGFDRADAAFREAGVPYSALSRYDTLIEAAVTADYLAPADLDTLREWRKDPQNWGRRFAE